MIIEREREEKIMRRFVENLQYLTLALLIIGQSTVGSLFYLGQGAYLAANLISVFRCFSLGRPVSDKVKDVVCLAITIGLLAIKTLGIKS